MLLNLNNINNKTQNIINDYCSIINNNEYYTLRKITPYKIYNTHIQRKNIIKINRKNLRENINKNNIDKNSFSTKLLIKNNTKLCKKLENHKINEKNKSVEKYNKKINENKIKKNYLYKNILSKNILLNLSF